MEITNLTCPYCGAGIELCLDRESSDYIEDCEVCCRPMHIQLDGNGDASLSYEE